MVIGSWAKVAVAVAVLVVLGVLAGLGQIDGSNVVALAYVLVGYVFGNGHGLIAAQRVLAATSPATFGQRASDEGEH